MSRRIAVAVSGGRDSTALMHACVRAAKPVGVEVVALHVNHGLMTQADAWQKHVDQQCSRWRREGWPLAFRAQRLCGTPTAGDSVEAWARRGRYRALGQMAHDLGIDTVLLAHHRTDQAETVVLQALRGGGTAGLSAMPGQAHRDGIWWLRPWLDQPRRAIDAYVRRYRLSYVEDSSNLDDRFARNRLRHGVWPGLLEAFPHAESNLVSSARRLHEANLCLRELAEVDSRTTLSEDGRCLHVKTWAQWSSPRRANLLRQWLGSLLSGGTPDSLIYRLTQELPSAHGGASWPVPEGALRLRGGWLRWSGEPAAT